MSPNFYLRDKDNLLKAERSDGSDVFKKEATWLLQSGISNQAGYSFRSFLNRDHFICHQGFRVKNCAFSGEVFPQDSTWFVRIHPPVLELQLVGQVFRFESARFRGRFINVRDSTRSGALKEAWIDNSNLRRDRFTVVPGLHGEGISFQTKDGEYLFHTGFQLFSTRDNGNQQLRKDGTFIRVRGLSDPQYYSFKSVNFPTRFIRQEGLRLKISDPSTPPFDEDATWIASV